MKKETSKQESYVSYLNGVIHGIELAREVFADNKDIPSVESLLTNFKARADKANERLEKAS